MLTALAQAITDDYLRWNEFDKSARARRATRRSA